MVFGFLTLVVTFDSAKKLGDSSKFPKLKENQKEEKMGQELFTSVHGDYRR